MIVHAHCFPIRIISLWKRLPASIVSAENIHMFKKLFKARLGLFLRNVWKGLILILNTADCDVQ